MLNFHAPSKAPRTSGGPTRPRGFDSPSCPGEEDRINPPRGSHQQTETQCVLARGRGVAAPLWLCASKKDRRREGIALLEDVLQTYNVAEATTNFVGSRKPSQPLKFEALKQLRDVLATARSVTVAMRPKSKAEPSESLRRPLCGGFLQTCEVATTPTA